MSLYHLSNEHLSVSVSDKGAELQSIVHKQTGYEYMWSGNPDFWAKKSPVLFPIVGGLRNNTYQYRGNDYVLGRHGFARDRVFTVVDQSADSIRFALTSDTESLLVYPFQFVFQIGYQLDKNSIQVSYYIENTDTKELYFSVGAHPAFAVPFVKDTVFEDYYLQFSQPEYTGIWPLSPEGLIQQEAIPFLKTKIKSTYRNLCFMVMRLFLNHCNPIAFPFYAINMHMASKSLIRRSLTWVSGVQKMLTLFVLNPGAALPIM